MAKLSPILQRSFFVGGALCLTLLFARADDEGDGKPDSIDVEKVAAEAAQPTVTSVYRNDFSDRIEIDQWSHTATPKAPSGRRILMLDGHTTFEQGELPEHEFIRLRLNRPLGSPPQAAGQ